MRIGQRQLMRDASSASTAVVAMPARLDAWQAMRWLWYHVRLLNGWLFVLTTLGFLCAGGLAWLQMHIGSADGLQRAADLCRFVMEPGAGLLAAMLASSLIVNDPLLEVTITSPIGMTRVVIVRAVLTFVLLALCSGAYLLWSLASGISYARQQTPLILVLMWLAPVMVMGSLGLAAALATRNAALGVVLAAVPLAGSLFLYPILLQLQPAHLFLLTYTFSGGYEARDWLANRLVLLGCALVLDIASAWLLLGEERLLASAR